VCNGSFLDPAAAARGRQNSTVRQACRLWDPHFPQMPSRFSLWTLILC
jgi:hypothetical protein